MRCRDTAEHTTHAAQQLSREAAKVHLEAAGIEIPYNQLDLYIKEVPRGVGSGCSGVRPGLMKTPIITGISRR